jgi:TorA maturation chaperone TorD
MDELFAVMETRTSIYHLLARVFRRETDSDFLKELKTFKYPQNTGNEKADEGYRLLHHYLSDTNEATLNELAVDYARVFLGSGALDATAAYPFESVYTSLRGLTMQEARDEVLAIYRSMGLEKNSSWREGEDHVALEFEFLKYLSLQTIKAIEHDDSATLSRLIVTQTHFFQNHIINWVPAFTRNIRRYAKTDFYQAFSLIVDAYLEEDAVLLEDLLAEVNPSETDDGEIEVLTPC